MSGEANNRLEIRLLGPLEVLREGRPCILPQSRKTRALLAYLVATERQYLRQHLCNLFWDGPADPRAALRWSLSKLRTLTDETETKRICAREELVGFARAGAHVDLHYLRGRVGTDVRQAPTEALAAAAGTVRGEFLEGLDLPERPAFDAWLKAEREAVASLRDAILAALADRHGDVPEMALTYARQRIVMQPANEAAHAQVMRTLAEMGRPQEAQAQFAACRRILAREAGACPSSELEALRRRLAPTGLRAEAAASPPRSVERESPPALASRSDGSRAAGVAKTRLVHDVMVEALRDRVVGREEELRFLETALTENEPLIVYLHGIPGIGKSTVLRALAERVRSRGIGFTMLDGKSIEPTTEIVAGLVATALEPTSRTATVVAIDNFEALELIETWFRQVLLPQLPARMRIMLVSRRPPSPGWHIDVGVQGIFRTRRLDVLTREESRALLKSFDLASSHLESIVAVAKGHPLTLVLAAAHALEHPAATSAEAVARTLNELSRYFLDDSSTREIRPAIEVAALVRRVSRPLLSAVLPDADLDQQLARLRGLPFIEAAGDGLAMHDAVREPIAARLQTDDPERYLRLRRDAWRHLQRQRRRARPSQLWDLTADTIFLLRNPVVREAFFPTRQRIGAVEQATVDDIAAIAEIARAHEPDDMAALITAQTGKAHRAFHVARWPDGSIGGFYWAYDPAAISFMHIEADPIARIWWRDMERRAKPRRGQCLFIRRWLSRWGSDGPNPVQAQMWLDLKRLYMEMRPDLRWVYITLRDMAPYADVAAELGFTLIEESPFVTEDGHAYSMARLDMGPESFDGWIDDILAREIGDPSDDLLDEATRRVRLGEISAQLTPTEFSVMRLLYANAGRPVGRDDLLHKVWGEACERDSNVVDVAVAGLRRKLDPHAGAIRTVRGVGYAYEN